MEKIEEKKFSLLRQGKDVYFNLKVEKLYDLYVLCEKTPIQLKNEVVSKFWSCFEKGIEYEFLLTPVEFEKYYLKGVMSFGNYN